MKHRIKSSNKVVKDLKLMWVIQERLGSHTNEQSRYHMKVKEGIKFVKIKELPHKVVPWINGTVKVSTGLSRCFGQPVKGCFLQRNSPASLSPYSWSSVCPSPPAAAARAWFPHTPPANDSHSHLFSYFLCFKATLGASRAGRRMNAEAISCKSSSWLGWLLIVAPSCSWALTD